MNQELKRANDLLTQLHELLPMSLENRKRLEQKIRLEFNYNSNHMEGNTMTYGETKLLLIKDIVTGTHSKRELDEMQAHDLSFDLIKSWANDKERALIEKDLRDLNGILLVKPFYKEAITHDGQPTRRLISIGQYKEHPNSVRLQNGELFHYSSPTETPIKMKELMEWYVEREHKKDLHPIELAALFHHKFVLIHPFDDGNGRISRLIVNYILIKNGFQPIVIKSSDKKNYLNALSMADIGNNLPFINYIAKEVQSSLELAIKAAKGEPIEEPNDWEKELSVLEKRGKDAPPLRTQELTLNRVLNSLKPLIENLSDTIHRNFEGLFRSVKITYKVNHRDAEIINRGEISRLEMIDLSAKEAPIQFIRLKVLLENYIKNGSDTFSLFEYLDITFKDYNFELSFPEHKGFSIQKDIDKDFTTEEINSTLNNLGNILVSGLKARLQK